VELLHQDPANIQALLGASRALHTLKGNASALAVEPITRVASSGESLLDHLSVAGEAVSPTHAALLSDLEGALRHLVDTLDRGEAIDVASLGPLLAAFVAGATAPRKAASVRRAPFAHDLPPASADFASAGTAGDAPAAQGLPTPVRLTQPASELPHAEQASGHMQPATPQGSAPPVFIAPGSSQAERSRTSLTGTLTAVDLGDIDRSIDVFGRVVTSRTMIARGVADLWKPASENLRNSQRLRRLIDRLAIEFEGVRRERRAAAQHDGWDPVEMESFDAYAQIMLELGEIVADQEEITGIIGEGVRRTELLCENDKEATGELQKALLGMRLVRLHTLEPRLDQVITSTARALGKQVSWSLQGGAVAVDKTVLDALQEPLLHLLRNAVDHGIEAPMERSAQGKPPAGSLTVSAFHGANSVTIRVADDGRGIEPAAIAEAAVQHGVLGAADAAALDDQARLDLIWQPGFSTATTVTEISGRGLGLDIVRAALARVRGSVTVESIPGQGTTFVLSMPLSLSVVRTLLLRDGTATIAVPITQIRGVHLIRLEAVTRLSDRVVAQVEGRTIDVMEQGLGRPLALVGRSDDESVALVEVRMSAEHTVGLVVDEILGEEDTLVKALPSYLQHLPAFVGCSVAADGRPYAIVDLCQLAAQWPAQPKIAPGPAPAAGQAAGRPAAPPATQPLVLIVDDSPFMRRSLVDLYESSGFRLATAEDGEAALAAIAHSGMPDLISLDMEMPRMNGLEMLSILRQLPGGQEVPVFMISTRGQERHRQAALQAGVTRYFIKPYDSEDVLAAAREACHLPQATSSVPARAAT
jgi:chemosensory pili system protein ChpA (sensor histidine kinase/response regulator)